MTTDVYAGYGTIVDCDSCGLSFRNPRETEDVIRGAYSAMVDEDYRIEADCRAMNAHVSLRRIRKHRAGGRLLEVGCSAGYFLNAARTSFAVEGVEPCAWAARRAESDFGVKVWAGSYESFSADPESFDVVVALDVLEHLTSPADFVRRMSRLLKTGGLLYLVTPDIGSLSARCLGSYWWGLRPSHLTYFSRRTLRSLLQGAGFEVAEMRSYGRMFSAGYWLSRLRNYPALLRILIKAGVALFGGKEKLVYLNTRDSLEAFAVKRRGE